VCGLFCCFCCVWWGLFGLFVLFCFGGFVVCVVFGVCVVGVF
jgi:hypothetical protein